MISSSVYAKYYFALRAIGEKANFRRRYNDLVHVQPEKSQSLEVGRCKLFIPSNPLPEQVNNFCRAVYNSCILSLSL